MEYRSGMAGAKRHHFIPQFLLRNFSSAPTAKNAPIWRLEKATGRIAETRTTNEAVIGHFHRLEELEGVKSVEEDLAQIEGLCKPAIQKAIAREDLTREDAELIVLFSVLQDRRTPRARQWTAELMEHGYRVIVEVEASKGSGVRDMVKAKLGREPIEEEVDAARAELVADLQKGRLVVQTTGDHEVLSTFLAASDVARTVLSGTRLACLHAIKGEFVLSDHPVCMFDPTVPYDRGVGWISSPATEVTFPVSRDTCLMFRPGPPGYAHIDAAKDVVTDMNLRSYASAEWSVYGSNQRWLQDSRTSARRHRAMVLRYEPHKRHLIFFESESGLKPHAVQVAEPMEKVVRGFRPRDRPARRPPDSQPITDRLLREWSRLVPDEDP
jgi:hypothetical protein